MRRIIFTLTILIACVAWNTTLAETKETRAENPHELRLGVGDCSIYYAQRYSPHPGSYVDAREFDVLLPNIFIDYQYRVNSWFAAGVQINTIWDKGSDYIFDDFTGYPACGREYDGDTLWFNMFEAEGKVYIISWEYRKNTDDALQKELSDIAGTFKLAQ